ncbi:MAG: ParB/RepB/Spo0J family partition protein, partial [Prevotellaceae bacterium]|nr:ParB/RepB/Spo0J family partition protein [Prevotellaceae bacterium]
MAKELKLNLPPADDLFSTQEERDDAKREKVLDIPLSEIDAFPDHPFQVKLDESMQAMAESVKTFGIQTPAIVRQKEDGRYELVSGHRRKMACELAGLDTMPCIVRQMNRDEAIISMVDSNLQRETILPSEKAKSYRMRLEAMKRQAGRPGKNSVPVAQNFEGKTSRELLGEKVGESQDQIRRYIRLTELIPQVLDMVDAGKIA